MRLNFFRKYFVASKAICDSRRIGKGTRIWNFSHILPGASIGADCNICENVFVENDVRIGDRVTIKNGVQLWDGTVIEDDVFIGPNVTFTNDKYPKSGNKEFVLEKTTVKSGASVGANSTILPGLTLGRNSIVGAGSVVVRDVPDGVVVMGCPATERRVSDPMTIED